MQRKVRSLEALATEPSTGPGLSEEVVQAARRAGLLASPAPSRDKDKSEVEDEDEEEDPELVSQMTDTQRNALANATKTGSPSF